MLKGFAVGLAFALLAGRGTLEAAPQDSGLALGVRQAEEGEFQAAITTLNGVIQRLSSDGLRAKDLARAYLYRGIAHIGMGEDAPARADFKKAVLQDSTLRLSPRSFAPKIIRIFDEVKAQAAATAPPKDRTAVPLFFEAVKLGDIVKVKQFLRESPWLVDEADDEFEATALHWAALKGYGAMATVLIEAGAFVNSSNKDGETPLTVAERARRSEVIQLLRAAGGSTLTPGAALLDAVQQGDIAKVRDLVGGDPALVRARDPRFGASPLHWAALKGFSGIVAFLISSGADVNALNGAGETPLTVAQRTQRTEIVQLLTDAGAKTSVPLEEFFQAVKAGDVERVRQLLGQDPSLLKQKDGSYGATALHWAALRGHAALASFLIASGADVRATNGNGETPLEVAQRAGKSEVVQLFRNP